MPKRPFQFSLRSLFVLTTLSAILFALGAVGLAVLTVTIGALQAVAFAIIVYGPRNPFRREHRRQPPPHQFDSRFHG